MIYIAHRGNLYGPKPELENSPDYIDEAIKNGYNVEVDIWCTNNQLFLGHDKPQYPIDVKYLLKRYKKLWCHCKNLQALDVLLSFKKLHVFVHDKDMATLTSQNFVWTYPASTYYTRKSICVMPELDDFEFNQFDKYYAICTDYVIDVEKYFSCNK